MKTTLTFLQSRRKDLHCALDATCGEVENKPPQYREELPIISPRSAQCLMLVWKGTG